jgi:hypothetical protein
VEDLDVPIASCHLDGICLSIEQDEREDAPSCIGPRERLLGAGRRDGQPHSRGVLDVVGVVESRAYLGAVGKLGEDIQRARIGRRDVLVEAGKAHRVLRGVQSDQSIAVQVAIRKLPEVIVAVPVDHDLILYPRLQAAECHRGESALDGIPIDPQVDRESGERGAVADVRTRHCYAVGDR